MYQQLSLLLRIAFIGNIAFALLILWHYGMPLAGMEATVIILAYMSFILNALIAIITLGMLLLGKKLSGITPKWVLIVDICFIVPQVLYLFFK